MCIDASNNTPCYTHISLYVVSKTYPFKSRISFCYILRCKHVTVAIGMLNNNFPFHTKMQNYHLEYRNVSCKLENESSILSAGRSIIKTVSCCRWSPKLQWNGRSDSQPQMDRLSLRNNWFKFTTVEKLPAGLEEFIEYTSSL